MDHDFWHQRWLTGEIGWHQDAFNPHLRAYWPPTGVEAGARVLVPLCGKTRDLLWLAGEGYRVLGVEISALGVEAFFTENGLTPTISDEPPFKRYRIDELEILCGDFFALGREQVADVTALFDRAALIALPPALRARYARHLHTLLPPAVSGLLITLDYDQAERPGPPFAVTEPEIRTLFAERFRLSEIAALDLFATTPRYREQGLTHMMERVYGLRPFQPPAP
ncbi:MAG: thiopurine S-methyltransferase [Chromatiaceae bacterium]